MSSNVQYLRRFRSEAVTTATPAQLLGMLYDRLLLDIDRADAALTDGRRIDASEQLLHAQDIVHELAVSLDRDAWDGADGLASLYDYLRRLLVDTNLTGDQEALRAARGIVEPLADAWRIAASQVTPLGVSSQTSSGMA